MNVVELGSLHQLDRLATVLMHSVWQTALVVCVAGLLARSLWKRSPNAPIRYAIHTSALMSILLMPVVTWVWIGDRPLHPVSGITSADSAPSKSLKVNVRAADTPRPSPYPPTQLQSQPIDSTSIAVSSPRVLTQDSKISGQIIRRSIAGLWLAGVALFSLRLLRGMVSNFALQRNIVRPTEALQIRIRNLSQRLGWTRTPRVGVSDRVQQAIVTGYFRSIVLLPLSWTTQLPADVLDAVIAHELAHVRRYDTWVILLQRIVETLLFFHPAVWWLSGRISFERELCCDGLAVRATGCASKYAAALEHIGQLLQGHSVDGCQLSPSIGGQKMELLHRVKHVLDSRSDGSDRGRANPAAIAAILPVLWIGLIVVLMRVPVSEQPPREEAPTATSAEDRSSPISKNGDKANMEGLEIRESADRVAVELQRPATLSDEVVARLQTIQNPIRLTIRADVDFSADNDVVRLKSIPHLKSLSLDVPIEDRHLQHLAELSELEGLSLEESSLSRDGMRQLSQFRRLKYVGLWQMDVDDDDVRELLKLKTLRSLQLQNCNITAAIIPEISQLSGLTSLGLQGCPLRAADVAKLVKLPDLQSLHISSVDPFTGDAILSACSRFGNLKYLDLEGVTCTIVGIRQLRPAANLHNVSLSGTIGPLFYPNIGPAYLKARELRFAALYTSEKSYFGGSANWKDARFTLDAVYDGELMSEAEYLSVNPTAVRDSAIDEAAPAIDFPSRIQIHEWRRGMSDEEFKTKNVGHSPRVDTSFDREPWANGDPTRLHHATVEVSAKWDGGSAFCRGVTVYHHGIVAVPTAFLDAIFDERSDDVANLKLSVVKAPLADSFEAKIVGRYGPVSLIQSQCEYAYALPISFTKPTTGDKAYAMDGLRWNDELAIAGVLASQETVTVPPSLESFSNEPVTHADLVITNLPQSRDHLGTPLTNAAGELIGLCLPLQNSDGRGYAISVDCLRAPLLELASQAEAANSEW